MKQITSFTLFLLLLILAVSVTLASPIMPTTEQFAFYVTGESFGGGDIDGYKISKNHGLGMGASVPINSALNVGIRFGSNNYSDNNFALQANLFPKKDGYLYRLDINRCGSDGTITHVGIYRDFPDEQLFSLCGGGGASLVHISNASKNIYYSMFVELQARVKLSEGFFGYAGGSYDYHLGATTLEMGVGMTL
jgi:hypothetical protein